jgi:hypothetical protein
MYFKSFSPKVLVRSKYSPEVTSLLVFEAVPLGQQLPLFLGIFLGLVDAENEGSTIFRKVRKYSSSVDLSKGGARLRSL